jgi:uncharacterized protein (DUF885 family)
MRSALILSLGCLVLPACGGGAQRRGAEARDVAGEIDRLAREYWAELLRHSPVMATSVGERSADDQLPDLSQEERERHLAALAELEGRAERLRSVASGEAAVTLEVLAHHLAEAREGQVCRFDLWRVDPLYGPQEMLGELPSQMAVRPEAGEKDVDNLIQRYQGSGIMLEDVAGNLRLGLAGGYAPARVNVEQVIRQLDQLVAERPDRSPLSDQKLPAGWDEKRRTAAHARLAAAVRDHLYPALRRFRQMLADEVLPRARPEPGLLQNRGGEACYRFQIQMHTGTTLSPAEIHAIGMADLKTLSAEMAVVAKAAGGPPEPRAFMRWLAARPDQYLKDEPSLLARNRALLQRAQEAMPRAFGRLPRRPIEVRPLEPHRAPSAPAAFYHPAPDDRSRPAVYYVNTHAPERRPLYNAPALTFHEAVPGHHLQIAIAQDLALPDFRRHLGHTAFVEGWALYAERLADELGLYRTPVERFGMLNYQAWRASRLVVDTGIHAMGWTREQAIAFMEANTALPRQEIENEIDRYIVDPGQALAYRLGQKEMEKLRAQAQAKEGKAFDLKAFHDRLLRHGALPPAVLRRLMGAG